MDDSILEFVKSVQMARCRVVNTPHLIFLCGGLTSDPKVGPVLSARDHFFRYVNEKAKDFAPRIRLAEKINDWFDQDTFGDLLELEEYLADSSDLTILFVESPGSIAELGAFAASNLLGSRTLAVLNSTHRTTRTFIADGPVRRIRAYDENLIRNYEWNADHLTDPMNRDVFDDMSRDLVEYIRNFDRGATKEQTLNKDSHGHRMFLIADLIDLIGIATAKEIGACLTQWGFEIESKTLRRYFALLEHLGLLKKKLDSDKTYFMRLSASPLIRYDFSPSAKLRDRDRIKSIIRTALAISDERRMRVYQREIGGASSRRRRRV